MNKKLFVILILSVFMFGLVNAESIGDYQANQPMQITNYCEDATCTYMNLISLEYPNATIIYPNISMDNNNQIFNYSYIPTELGIYTFKTCGDPSGIIICNSDTFNVTPSGNSGTNNILLYIIILVLGYILNLLGFFNKNVTITILGGIILIFVGIYMLQNGIIIYRDNLTLAISYITLFWGAGSALWAAVEEIQDSM